MTEADERLFEEPKARRPWWRRKRWIVYLLILLVAGGGEWLASRAIRAKLNALVERKLDARLDIGTIIYVPPYGASAWGVKLVRGGEEILSLPKATIRLAQLPIGTGPIIISRFWLEKPALSAGPDTFKEMVKPSGRDKAPKKLADMLRLKELHLVGGRIRWREGKEADSAMVWDSLALDADMQQQAPSRYNFHVISRAGNFADASATGAIDVDDLLLDVQNLLLKARAEPEPKRSPLPASVQQVLKRYRITGSMTLAGSGKVALRDPDKAACQIKLTLDDATALLPFEPSLLDHARASLVCQKQPAGPVQIKIEKIDVAGSGKTILIDTGAITLDTAAGTWKVTDLLGHAQVESSTPATTPSSTRPTRPPSDARPNPVDKYDPEGRLDFTVAASGPLDLGGKRPWQAIQHEVIVYPRGFAWRPKNFSRRIEDIDGGEVRLVNGMIIFQELRGKYADDEIRLRGARLPAEGLPKQQRWQEISGVINFHQPTRRYSPKLDKILELLDPSGPFLVAGSYTYDKTGPTTRRSYDLIVSSDAGAMTLTPRKITFSKIRGDATVTPDGVEVHAAEADVLGGRAQVSGSWRDGATPADVSVYQGEAILRDVDVTKLEEQLRDDPPTRPMQGRAYVEGSFGGVVKPNTSTEEDLKSLQSAGQFEVVGGSLFQLPVFKNITREVKGLKQATTVGDAAAAFEIEDGAVRLRDVAVNSPVLGLQGNGTVAFNGALDFDVVAAPLADWRDKIRETRIPLVSNLTGELVGGIQKMLNTATGKLLYQFRVGGTLKDVKVTTVPTPVLTDAAALVFGKMLTPRKGERPLDWLKREPPKKER